MNHKDIAQLSADLIMRYYDNDTAPFLAHFDDESLWYGPAEGQFIQGRDAMLETWSEEEHELTFTVGDMKVQTACVNSTSCNVMLSYPVITHYPDGQDISVNQRLLLCWAARNVTGEDGKQRKEPRILVCHISNPHQKDDEDIVYPKRFSSVYAGKSHMPQKGERLHFHGVDRSEYFYLSDSIVWIESTDGSLHSILHTAEGDVEVLDTVASLSKKYPHLFVRCHQSYLVNPNYIRRIHRFKVTLTNGVLLPIPEKKYTAFRDQVTKLVQG